MVAPRRPAAPVSWIGRVQVGANSRIERVVVDPIPFAPGSATLAPDAQEQVARLAAFLEQVPEVRLALVPVVSSRDLAALEEKAREPRAGLIRWKKATEPAELATERLEAVREGIKRAGGNGERLKVAAPSAAESGEGQVKVDLIEPEDPGRPGFLRRLLGQTRSGGSPAAGS